MRLYGDAGVAIATGVLTFVVLVFAEVLPKTIAALYPESGLSQQLLLAPLQILMMPLVWLLNTITRLLMRLMGIKTDIVVSGSLSKRNYALSCMNPVRKSLAAIRICCCRFSTRKGQRG